jgi:hypothetical protein
MKQDMCLGQDLSSEPALSLETGTGHGTGPWNTNHLMTDDATTSFIPETVKVLEQLTEL